jgi:acyl carrier protein
MGGLMQTLEQLTEVFQEVFDDDEISLSRSTTAQDIEGWDSLMHVTLIVKVEKHFGIRFRSADVAALKSVGDLVDLVEQSQGAMSA